MFPSVNEQMDLIKRGVEEIVPEEELVQKLEKSLKTGNPLIVKEGFDPTAPDLHLGHMISINKLRDFQVLGHQVVFVIGDFTGIVGDPSGKSETRKMMTREDLEKNAQTYKDQVFKVLDPDKTQVRFNSEWLGKMTIYDFLGLSSKMTVARMLERNDFEKRFKDNTDISILEFLYVFLQAYDSVALKADVELGGTDQKFNLLAGRTIQRRYGLEEQVAVTLPLLVGTDGVEKMSKSLGNYIGISEEPKEIFGKIMSIPDELIVDYYYYTTKVSVPEIEQIKNDLKGGINPRNLKSRLGREIVSLYYSSEKGEEAEAEFSRVFSQKKLPEKIPEFSVKAGESVSIIDLLRDGKLCNTGGEARRLVKQNAVSINGEKVSDVMFSFTPEDGSVIKAGKRRYLKICIK